MRDKHEDSTATAQSECNGLLACPFCGCSDVDIRKRKTVIIECKKCKVLFIRMTVSDAKKAWNTRSRNVIAEKVLFADAGGRVISMKYKDSLGRRCTLFITSGAINHTDKIVSLINNGS